MENNGRCSMTICKLPAEVQSALRSGVVIASMAQCVDELVLNAIDAGSTSIAVRVNFKFHKIQVIDNGCGLNCTHLDLIGTRYMTSKCHSLDDLHNHLDKFGFRGEALASLREVSGLLTFESRPKGSDITYCKVFTHGKSHKAGVSKIMRPGQGTTITVHDFMYNMPVRKQRIRSAVDLEEIKSHMECIAVMQPQISFSLRNDTDGKVVLHTRKYGNTLSAFSYLYGETVAQSLAAVSSQLGHFKINGYISRETHHQKNLQFIYVNKRLILKSKLHKLANSMLGNSFLLKTNTSSRDIPISKEISTGRWLAFSPPRKRDKYAVYLLNVECPYYLYDVCFDPKKTLIEFCDWDNVLQCMELAIRTFLEKEYSLTASEQSSSSYSVQGKNSGSNVVSVLKKVEHVEKEYTVGQLKIQNVDPTDILNQEKNSDIHGLSENVAKKMLNVSRAVFGMPAKRQDKNEGTCCRGDLCLHSAALTFEEADVESEITINLDSGADRSNEDVLTTFTSNHTLQKCDSENPFPSLETYSVSQQRITPLTGVQKEHATDLARRNFDHLICSLSDIPLTASDSEKLSIQCMFTKTGSDLYPIERFRNYLNNRTQPDCQSKHTDLPPITKFRETFHCVSNGDISMPFKTFEWHALKQFLRMSGLLKKGVNLTNKCDKSDVIAHFKNATVGDSETSRRDKHAHKGDSSSFFHKPQTNFKCLLGERTKMHADVSNMSTNIYMRARNNCALGADQSLQHSLLQDAAKLLSDVNVPKPSTEYEHTENKGTDVFEFERAFSQCITDFPDELLKAKGVSDVCASSSYKGPVCKEFNIPHKEVIEVEECVQFQLPNNAHRCRQNQRETSLTATASDIPDRSHLQASDMAHNNERNSFNLFNLASTSEVKNAKEHLCNRQQNHSAHKRNKHTDQRGMFSLIKDCNQVQNQLKLIHPQINVCKWYTKTCRENYSFSRNYYTSYDFLHTLEREETKQSKCTAWKSMPICQTDLWDEHAVANTFSCSENLHSIPAYRKSLSFNCADKSVFNSNCEGKTVQLFTIPGSSHSVNVEEECVRPDSGSVTFRFSPKIEMTHQSGCRNILKFFSSNSDVLCGGELMKDVQHAESVRNHSVDGCRKSISQAMLSSNSAMLKRQVGNNMILSSGSEADIESGTDTEPCLRKRRRVNILSCNKTGTEKGRPSKFLGNSECSYAHAKYINNSHSEECLKQKMCYSVKESRKWNELSNQQHDDKACLPFQQQEKIVGCLPSDRQGSSNRMGDKSLQMPVDEGVSQILDDSNDTIVPSSSSSDNLLSHFSQTANCKMIVSDSDSDISLHADAVTSNKDPGNLPYVQNRLTVSSDGNTTQNQDHCSRSFSHETEEGNIIAETDSICICFGQNSSEVEARRVGILESHVPEGKGVEDVCTELSPAGLSGVIDTLKIVCISDFPSKENCTRTAGNEGSISEVGIVNSGDKSNTVPPKVTVVQEVSQSCNSLVNNRTDKLDNTIKNNSESTSHENESLLSKRSLPSDTIKCGISGSSKGIKDEVLQLLLMESTSGEGQLLSFRGLSQSNAEHCGTSAALNSKDGGITHVLTREEGAGVGRLACDSELLLSFKELLLKNKKICCAYDTFSLAKKNNMVVIRGTVSDSGSAADGQKHLPFDDNSVSWNSVNPGKLAAGTCNEDGSTHTLRQDGILNSECSASVQQYETHSFCKSTQCNNNDACRLSNNVSISDRKCGNDIMPTDFNTSEQIAHINATESEGKCSLFKNLEAGNEQNLSELLHPGACTVTNGQILREKQSDLLDRKRRSGIDCLDKRWKRRCMGQPTESVSMHKCKPCNNNDVTAPDVYMSNSVSTQDLNEAFDNIMNKVVESDTNKKENCAFTIGQDNAALDTLGNGTVEMDRQEGTDKISCNPKDISLKCPEGWEQKLDPKGRIFFVHVETGLTSYVVPSQLMTQNLYTMSKRFAFLPKGMSPILKNTVKKSYKDSEKNTLTPISHQALCNVITDSYCLADELAVVKWKDVHEERGRDCRDLVKRLLAESDNRMQFCEKEVPSACTEELPKSIVKVYNVIYPYTFSKDIFSDLKVLGQLDNKFIVTVVGPRCVKNQNVIVLFDQHAVHERIRLEGLMKDYLVEGSDSEFRTAEVNPCINLKLSTKEVRILSSFQRDFEKLGLKFEVMDDADVQITHVPTCLLAREQREMHGRGLSVLNGFVESMIREQVDSILTTRGVGIRLPHALQSVISSEACRGAVKFGDALYPEECAVLLKNLSRCQVPFQCAHGRPALVPIVDLQHLHIQAKVRPKPQLWKLKKRSENLSNL